MNRDTPKETYLDLSCGGTIVNFKNDASKARAEEFFKHYRGHDVRVKICVVHSEAIARLFNAKTRRRKDARGKA